MMRTHKLRWAVRCLTAVAGGGLLASSAPAGVTLYTSSTAFFNDLATNGFLASTQNFDSTTAGTTVSDGGSVGGITFSNFNLGVTDLLVDNSFATTSGSNYLGTDDAGNSNLIIGGDAFDLAFAASNAIGFNLITAETPNTSIFDNDVQIIVPGSGTALLDVDALESTLVGGDSVFFIGLIDDAATFTTAEIRYDPSAVNNMTFNVDDITVSTAVPEASEFALVMLGSLGLLARRRLRSKIAE